MKRAAVLAAPVVLLVLAAVSACRNHQPDQQPHTPPNSPLPDIDRPDDPVAAPDEEPDAG